MIVSSWIYTNPYAKHYYFTNYKIHTFFTYSSLNLLLFRAFFQVSCLNFPNYFLFILFSSFLQNKIFRFIVTFTYLSFKIILDLFIIGYKYRMTQEIWMTFLLQILNKIIRLKVFHFLNMHLQPFPPPIYCHICTRTFHARISLTPPPPLTALPQ